MPESIKGKEVLEALAEYKEPVTLDEIVKYVAEAHSQPVEKVKKLVEEALNGGVRYGFVQKYNDFYYRVCDAVDAVGDSSEEDEEDDIESAESVESVDSGDVPPPPKKKGFEKRPGGVGRAPARQSSKSKKINKQEKERRERKCMDICSDEEDEDDYARYDGKRRRTHKCSSECDGLHRIQSDDEDDDNDYRRGRSRSASRRR